MDAGAGTDLLGALRTVKIPVASVLPALGLTSSILSFVLTNILARPAMMRWRGPAWWTFAFLWTSVLTSFVDILYPFAMAGIETPGTKLGVLLWATGLINLLWLVRAIFFTSFTAAGLAPASWRASWRGDGRFDEVRIPVFGVPFLDAITAGWTPETERIAFPVLLLSDRTAHGLEVAQRFVASGLDQPQGAAVWLAFTRPWTIVARQIQRRVATAGPGWSRRLVILDCYSVLYLSDERPDLGVDHRVPPGIGVRHCDPRDPVALKGALREALRVLRGRASTVRVVYDSLSDFISVADRELVVAYLRWSTVWDELYRVQSIHLVWPDVLKEPVSAEYLAWFGNTVLTLKDGHGRYTAELQRAGHAPIRVDHDERLEPIPVSERGEDRTLASRVRKLLLG
jgi:hypothetical protein